jgi:hypothetical protein
MNVNKLVAVNDLRTLPDSAYLAALSGATIPESRSDVNLGAFSAANLQSILLWKAYRLFAGRKRKHFLMTGSLTLAGSFPIIECH